LPIIDDVQRSTEGSEPASAERLLIKIIRGAATRAKRHIQRDTWLYGCLKKVNQSIPQSELKAVIASFARSRKDVFFVQVGAADGVNNDPIHQYIKKLNWSGIMVEPVPYLFEQLRQTYAGYENLVLENVAIADREEIRDFWHLKRVEKPHNLPHWYNQLGSFSRDHILKHADKIPALEDLLVRQPVKCVTMDSMLARNRVKRVDLLLVDTEGYDFMILKQFNFSRFSPRIIVYEHQHLSDADNKQCDDYLVQLKYKLIKDGGDTLAFL